MVYSEPYKQEIRWQLENIGVKLQVGASRVKVSNKAILFKWYYYQSLRNEQVRTFHLIYHIIISRNSSGIFLGFQIIFDILTISEVQSLLWSLIESIEGADIIPNAESNCEMFLKKNLFAAFWLFIVVVAVLKLIKLRETERVFTGIVQKNGERNGQSLLSGKPTFYMKMIPYAFDLTSYCLYSCQATKNQQPMKRTSQSHDPKSSKHNLT